MCRPAAIHHCRKLRTTHSNLKRGDLEIAHPAPVVERHCRIVLLRAAVTPHFCIPQVWRKNGCADRSVMEVYSHQRSSHKQYAGKSERDKHESPALPGDLTVRLACIYPRPTGRAPASSIAAPASAVAAAAGSDATLSGSPARLLRSVRERPNHRNVRPKRIRTRRSFGELVIGFSCQRIGCTADAAPAPQSMCADWRVSLAATPDNGSGPRRERRIALSFRLPAKHMANHAGRPLPFIRPAIHPALLDNR